MQHGSGFTVCILTNSDVLVYPPNAHVTPSITLERILEMIPAVSAPVVVRCMTGVGWSMRVRSVTAGSDVCACMPRIRKRAYKRGGLE